MATSKKTIRKASRVWLNDDKTLTATLSWYTTHGGGLGDFVDGELVIKDCSRSVTLDFCYDDAAKKKANLKKVDLMITELTKFRKALAG